jgi:phytanoyl-CoA hydroxylase
MRFGSAATTSSKAFDPQTVTSIFEAGGDQRHAADRYFQESGDTIRFFFEKGAFDERGQLTKDKHAALNKIGHAMHDLDPVFERFSRDPKLANLARSLGLEDPGLVQSMVIFKPPFIGGEVECHQDASFLHTDPVSVTGFWFALEDADESNGCLLGIPGVQGEGLRERFHYAGDALVMTPLGDKDWPMEREAPLPGPQGHPRGAARAGPPPLLAEHQPALPRGLRPPRDRPRHPLERRQLLRRGPGMPVRGF